MEDATMKTQKNYKEEELEQNNQYNEEDRFMHYNQSIWYN